MQVLIVNQSEVAQLLPVRDCMDVMEAAFKSLARGDAILPLRPVLWLPERVGALGMMPAYLGDLDAMGLKVVSVMPGNHGTEYDAHQGAVMLFEATHGCLLAIIDATEITAIRTAAATGVATRQLAREDVHDLAIIGSGVQAHTHLEAMLLARDIRRVRVWSPTASNVRRFAERETAQHGIEVEVAESAEAAVRGADIICTCTSAREPVLKGAWLSEGAHVNAIGSSVAFARELDTEAVVKSRLFVDSRESTLNEAGDFLFAKQDGAISDEHIQAEIGEVLLSQHPGRETAEEITLFKSLGIAVEDLAAAITSLPGRWNKVWAPVSNWEGGASAILDRVALQYSRQRRHTEDRRVGLAQSG